MSFSGNVETLPLDEVFQFVSSNSLEGMLTVAGGGARLTIYFADGQIFFPFTAKRGTYSLGKILRTTGVLSREALEKHMESARKNRLQELRALEGQASVEALETARRKQYEEEIHDVFLWRRAYFEFTPGPAPEEVQRERQLGKGAILDPTGLLMEVARRADERRRIRRSIPTSRAILVSVPGAEPDIDKALTARRIDVPSNPFTGQQSLEELLDAWGVPSHEALAAVSPLAEAGKIIPMPLPSAELAFQKALGRVDGPAAARFCAHLVELSPPPAGLLELGPEKALVTSPAFSGANEVGFTARLGGMRAFAVIRELVQAGIPFTATAREDGREKRLALSEEQISLSASTDDATPAVARYLRKSGIVSDADLKNAQTAADQGGTSLSHVLQKAGKISDEDWARAALEKVVDELAALVLWRDAELEVRNRCRAFSGKGEQAGLALALPMTPVLRNRLKEGMERWAQTAQQVPGEDAIFVLGERARADDPAAKFFGRFDGKRTVGELRRIAKADPLEFLRFVQGGVRRGYARAPAREELEERLQAAIDQQDDVRAYKLARCGMVLGYGRDTGDGGDGSRPEHFAQKLEELRARDAAPSPDARPSIEGDMEGLGLAAVLQGLRGRKRTGTLQLSDGKRETKLYFHRGALFLLRIEDAAAKEFVDFFLDGESQSIDFGGLEQGQVQEQDLDVSDLKKVKDEILEVLFWEQARFTFSKNDLPDEFFEPRENVTKVALNTDVFLMEAIGRIQEWDAIRQLIPSGRCVLAFASLEAKLEAIQSRGMAEVLTIVDGRHSFDDIVRISGQPRLEVGRLAKDLVEAGSVNVMAPAEPAAA